MEFKIDRFSVRDALLPLVLTQATIELDSYIIGKKTDFSSTKQIQEMLTRTLEQRQKELHIYSSDNNYSIQCIFSVREHIIFSGSVLVTLSAIQNFSSRFIIAY